MVVWVSVKSVLMFFSNSCEKRFNESDYSCKKNTRLYMWFRFRFNSVDHTQNSQCDRDPDQSYVLKICVNMDFVTRPICQSGVLAPSVGFTLLAFSSTWAATQTTGAVVRCCFSTRAHVPLSRLLWKTAGSRCSSQAVVTWLQERTVRFTQRWNRKTWETLRQM